MPKKKLSAQEEQTKRATQATHTTSGVRRELKKAQTDRQRAVDHAGALQTEVDEAHARAQVAEDSLERVTRRTEGTLAQLRTRNGVLEEEATQREEKLAQVSAQLTEALQYQEELRTRLGRGEEGDGGGDGGGVSSTMQVELERLRRLVQEGGAASGETPQGASMQYGELAELYGRLLEDRDRIAAEAETMREELSAFDPAFFEELEDLKYDFEQVRLPPTLRPSDPSALTRLAVCAGEATEPAVRGPAPPDERCSGNPVPAVVRLGRLMHVLLFE